jgi:hypothetical protein
MATAFVSNFVSVQHASQSRRAMISLTKTFQHVSRLFGPPDERMRFKTLQFAEKAANEIRIPCQKVKENLWRATAPENRGFVVQEDIMAHEQFVVIVAFAGITTDRQWVQWGLAIALLEYNQRFAYGSFRLDEHKNGMSVVLGYVCDTRQCDAAHVSAAAREILTEMQRALVELYARDLIILPSYRPRQQHA